MKNLLRHPCLFAAVSLTGSAGCAAPLTTGTLLREMIDLRRLADFPRPAYRTVQFSSYDRRSNLPGGPGWFANSDGFGGEPTPNFEAVLKAPAGDQPGEYLICDVRGPGAIVRTWTAAIAGALRVELDDAAAPLYEGPAAGFLACPYAAWSAAAGLDDAVLAGTLRQREAAYCPIPFARRCRIVWIGDVAQAHFYHVQVRLYEPGSAVATFTPEDLRTYAAELRTAARVLAEPSRAGPQAARRPPVPIAAALAPGATQEVLALEGPAALERLTLRLEAADRDLALRQVVLHVLADGHPRGQVEAPVGDFFGAAPGVNPYDSLPFTVEPDGTMTCRYVMPFKRALRIVLDNRGAQPATVTGSALPADYAWNDATSMHFRARWRIRHGVLAEPEHGGQDMPLLLAHGRGVYVGTTLLLLNPTSVPTTYGGWWGEGDEKVFIDQDMLPSIFGTGSEDYFNYAWSAPDIFTHAYCGQPRNDGPGNRGFVTNYRWHILDPLPFRERIAFYFELISHEPTPGMVHASIAYHYARPGTVDDHVAIRSEDLRPPVLPAGFEPAARCGALNTVFHHAEQLVQPGPATSIRTGRLWARERLLTWHPSAAGEELTLRVPVAADGKYALQLGLALDGQSGRVSVRLDGRSIGLGGDAEGIDLAAPHRELLRQFGSSPVELTAGEHTLVLRYEGPAAPGRTIGVNYVGVQQR